jgi:asparagine synthase (glutamine-hydrolysing)
MCGITGFNWKDEGLVKKMTDAIAHRGPDAEGFYTDQLVSLGHRRLSIIDLSENGRQPMIYKDFIIIFNGEIYNFQEIKQELVLLGHHFISNSDTEVILHAYEEWSEDCLNRFNGMWAFCLYDKKRNVLFLSRDRFGVKPIYYYCDDQKFIFASELKAIRQHQLNLHLNIKAINFYFYQKYIGDNLTVFENIYKLKPSEKLIYDIERKQIKLSNYYCLSDEILKAGQIPIKERLESIRKIIPDAVEKRLIADVPVGSFLSGGLDSSLISAIISEKTKNFDTFSIGFKEKSYNELEYSIRAAEYIKTKHHYKILDVDEQLIEFILKNLDEPFGDSSILPTYLLSKITREKVTVSLSGDAGDEIFGGYDTYMAYKISKIIPRFTIPIIAGLVKLIPASEKKVSLEFKLKRFVQNYSTDIIKRHLNWMATFAETTRKLLLTNHFVEDDLLIDTKPTNGLLSIQLIDILNYLPEDILKKVDTATMLTSLEARIPFLDYRLVPLVLSLPENYKIRRFKAKYFLKTIAKQYLPNFIINRKKRGFTSPITKWIQESPIIKQYLTKPEYFNHNFINKQFTDSLFQRHINKKEDHSRQLWLIFVFNYWMDKCFNINEI